MTVLQLLTIILTITIPLPILIYSNCQISEFEEELRAEMRVMQAEINAEFEEAGAILKRTNSNLQRQA